MNSKYDEIKKMDFNQIYNIAKRTHTLENHQTDKNIKSEDELNEILNKHSERLQRLEPLYRKLTENLFIDRKITVPISFSDWNTLSSYIKNDFSFKYRHSIRIAKRILLETGVISSREELNAIRYYKKYILDYLDTYSEIIKSKFSLTVDNLSLTEEEFQKIKQLENERLDKLKLEVEPPQTIIQVKAIYKSEFDENKTKTIDFVYKIDDFSDEIEKCIKRTNLFYDRQIDNIRCSKTDDYIKSLCGDSQEAEIDLDQNLYYFVPLYSEGDNIIPFFLYSHKRVSEGKYYETVSFYNDHYIGEFLKKAVSAFDESGFLAKKLIMMGTEKTKTNQFIKVDEDSVEGVANFNIDGKKVSDFSELPRLFSFDLTISDELERYPYLAFKVSLKNKETVSPSAIDDSVDFSKMTGYEFENYCAELLKKNGYTDVKVTQSSGDQGIDIIAYHNGVKFGIQCKNYSNTVGNAAIQEAVSGKAFYDCHVAVVMTNQYFTPAAKELAKKVGVVLWDNNVLSEMIKHNQ